MLDGNPFPQAQALITQLLEMSEAFAKTEQKTNVILSKETLSGEYEEVIVGLARVSIQQGDIPRKADAIVWRLWLTTGMAPLQKRQGEPLSAVWSRNAAEYQRYVQQHASLLLKRNLAAWDYRMP